MSKYIKNIYKLFETYDFYCNKFYVDKASNMCLFVGCTHSETGYHILVAVPDDIEMVFDRQAFTEHSESVMMVEHIECDFSENDTAELDKSITVAEAYNCPTASIDITGSSLDNALIEGYKHHVAVDKQQRLFRYNVTDICRQLNRLRYTISPITHYGLAIENRDVLVYTELHTNKTKILKLDKTPREARVLYIIISLDKFYDKNREIVDIVRIIHNNVLQVLKHNFRKQLQLIRLLLQKCEQSVHAIEEIHSAKDDLEEAYANLNRPASIADVVERVEMLNKINCISLCIDKISYDNLISYNNIVNNYELLIKLKLF